MAGPDEANLNIGNANIWRNGESQTAQWDAEWIFKPYNVNYTSRKQDLIIELTNLLRNAAFTPELQNIGENPFQNVDELYERLKDAIFVGRVLSNDVLRPLLKKSYEKIPGGTNENSLLLYSGPVSADLRYAISKCAPCRPWRRCHYYEAGCLYTGDSNADMTGWKDQRFTDVWDCIGTIQLPHHGSVDSLDVSTNPIDRPYIVPVACGSYNTYGHPSGKVLAYLMTNNCCTQIVTEAANTVFMEKIEKWR